MYDSAAQHQYEGSGSGTQNTATAFAKAAGPATAAPAAPANVMVDSVGPKGLHTLSDSDGSCLGARSAD